MTLLLVSAGICDIREKRIPNSLILSGWISGLCIRLWREGLQGLMGFAVVVLVAIAAGMPMFLLRAAGAGDVKLLSVIGGLYGLKFLLSVSVVCFFLAGIASLAILLQNRILFERFRYVWYYITVGRFRKDPYYNRERDGTKCTVILAPILAVAYVLVLVGRWGEVC